MLMPQDLLRRNIFSYNEYLLDDMWGLSAPTMFIVITGLSCSDADIRATLNSDVYILLSLDITDRTQESSRGG
jgi:hypothetical protein